MIEHLEQDPTRSIDGEDELRGWLQALIDRTLAEAGPAGFARAFLKAQLGAGVTLPTSGTVFISVKDDDKRAIVPVAKAIADLGFRILATDGTAKHLADQGLAVELIKKVREGRPHIVDVMKSGEVQLVFNTTEDAKAIADSFELRRTALTNSIPYSTTVAGARAAVKAIEDLRAGWTYFLSTTWLWVVVHPDHRRRGVGCDQIVLVVPDVSHAQAPPPPPAAMPIQLSAPGAVAPPRSARSP